MSESHLPFNIYPQLAWRQVRSQYMHVRVHDVSDLCGDNMRRVMFGDCAMLTEATQGDKDRATVIINLSQRARLAQSAWPGQWQMPLLDWGVAFPWLHFPLMSHPSQPALSCHVGRDETGHGWELIGRTQENFEGEARVEALEKPQTRREVLFLW